MLIFYFLSGGGKMRINEDNPRYQYYDDPEILMEEDLEMFLELYGDVWF